MDPTTSRGFSRPTTTPTPDELFDVWLPQLSGGELKVLLYIVRRTLGFKKDADTISLSQICSGITTKDGRVLDQGTGLSRNTAIQAIKGLADKGLVRVERGQDERGIHETNTYRLRFRGDDDDPIDAGAPPADQGSAKPSPGVVQKSHYGSAKNDPGVVQKPNPQQTATQQTEPQETEPPLPPAEEALPRIGTAGAGGGGDSTLPSDLGSWEGENPLADEQKEACRLLVEFGVWEKPARQLVSSLRLTPDAVRRACAALEAESAQGKPINNPSAILCHRLMQGWVPSEPEPPSEEEVAGIEEDQLLLVPQVERRPLPRIVDSQGREFDAYAWFSSLMGEVQRCMPRETFDTWLRGAALEDVDSWGSGAPRLTIRLANRYAYEWVSMRLHTAIQRIADAMLGYAAEIIYTAPEVEEAGRHVI